MTDTKRGRFTSAFWRSLGVFLLSIPMGTNAVEISNGVPEGTVGHYRVDVTAGGETREAFITAARFASNDIFTTEVVFDYSSLVDPGSDGFGFSLSSSDTVTGPFANPNNPNMVTSSGSFLGLNQNVILWTAVSSIAPGAQVMTTTYTFTAQTGALGPLRFLQYLDEDVQGVGDDVFFSTGLAGSGDLQLFTFDNTDVYGLSHSGTLLPGTGLQNASFAAGRPIVSTTCDRGSRAAASPYRPRASSPTYKASSTPSSATSSGRLISFPCWPGMWTRMRPVRSSPLHWAGSRYRSRPSRSVPSIISLSSVVGAATVRFRPRAIYRRPREQSAPIRSS